MTAEQNAAIAGIAGIATCNDQDVGFVDLKVRPAFYRRDDGADGLQFLQIEGLPRAAYDGCVVVNDGRFMHRFPNVQHGVAWPNEGYDPAAMYECWAAGANAPEWTPTAEET